MPGNLRGGDVEASLAFGLLKTHVSKGGSATAKGNSESMGQAASRPRAS
jgi:hypothetical protein